MLPATHSDNVFLTFTKAQSLGNDFVIVFSHELKSHIDITDISVMKKLVVSMSSRHYGVGCDQFILIDLGNDMQTPELSFYNCTGTKAKMCGNGVRAAGLLLLDKLKRDELEIMTPSGSVYVLRTGKYETKIHLKKPVIEKISDQADFLKEAQTQSSSSKTDCDYDFKNLQAIYYVNVGNEHVVLCFRSLLSSDLAYFATTYGHVFEHHPRYKNRVNVSFASLSTDNSSDISLVVYEREAGLTLACGSGAIATAAAHGQLCGVENYCYTVNQKGGSVRVEYNNMQSSLYISQIGLSQVTFAGHWILRGDYNGNNL